MSAFEWYRQELRKLELVLYDPVTDSTKARLIHDIRSFGLDYLGCYITVATNKCHVRPQDAKIQSAIDHLSQILTGKGRSSFPARLIEANAFASAWIASYRNVCGMSRVANRIAGGAARSIERLLRAKKIIGAGQTLSAEQRSFLGLELAARRNATRPTRARVRIPNRSRKRI